VNVNFSSQRYRLEDESFKDTLNFELNNSSILGAGRGADNTPHRKKQLVTKCYTRPRMAVSCERGNEPFG
jgi:hypothetical protein